jgi:RimJ/RimL family protein N-acetyltransferase
MVNKYLRMISIDDLPNLRQWKNDNCNAFFFKEKISLPQQCEWFFGYAQRPNDYMFMVLSDKIAIGCMGIRLIDNEWDLYNVILGLTKYKGKGIMSKALKELVDDAFILKPVPFTTKVLKDNPVINWYKKNGFEQLSEFQDHYLLLYTRYSL